MYTPPPAKSLRSEGMGLLLTIIICFGIGLDVLTLLFSLVAMTVPGIYSEISFVTLFFEETSLFEGTSLFEIAVLPVYLITVVTFLIWMYKAHQDLNDLFVNYQITPGQALARLMIPIYNLWGIWNVFSTLSDQLKAKGGELADIGFKLYNWLAFLYIATIGSRLLDRLVFRHGINEEGEYISPPLIIASFAANIFLGTVWFFMTYLIRRALKYRAASGDERYI